MSSDQYKILWVNLGEAEYQRVCRLVEERKLGELGFSAALRRIVGEWALMQQGLSLAQAPVDPGWAELLARQENGQAAPDQRYICRLVNLETAERRTVLKHAFACGYGERNFSEALRSILREWEWMRAACQKTQGQAGSLYTEITQLVWQSVTPVDRLLECGAVEMEIPSDTSEPGELRVPRLPKDESEAVWMAQSLDHSLKRY